MESERDLVTFVHLDCGVLLRNDKKTKPISLSPAATVSVKPSDGSTSLVTPWSSEQAMVTTSQIEDNVTFLPNSGQNSENDTKSTSVNSTGDKTPGNAKSSPRNSRILEATFTPAGDMSQTDGTTKVKGYHALAVEFTPTTSTSASTASVKKRGSRGDAGPLFSSSTEHLVSDHEEETVIEAVLAFVLSVFGPTWTLGIAYLHYEQGSYPLRCSRVWGSYCPLWSQCWSTFCQVNLLDAMFGRGVK
ncbi:uncharacterized protein LOC110848531 [Folsomia candida]|uniref:uncharacterized protein LOC110848531 n=1 Tax=Folsomia candida TaxID=158441 RepID=UPI000B9006DB|nr:uncharacterized protein LOC110848531 [Folsomia candida]